MMNVIMTTKYGKKLIELIEADIQRRMSEDYHFTIKDEARILGIEYPVLQQWLSKKEIARIDLNNLRAVVQVLPEALEVLGLLQKEKE